MQKKKKDKLLEKIVKKDFNNELEKVLEKKVFDENVKSILLSILYKLETAYKDYEQVKPDIAPKEVYIQKIINIIKDDCDDIKIVKLNSEENKILGTKTFLVEKKYKRIICYPIERKLLYCLAKISKNDKIIKDKYYIINRTLSDLINVGNNIEMVEPMRDFNGYSWTTIPREIESRYHNVCYQNMRILIGSKFMNKWIKNKEFIIDYFDAFKDQLEEKYGQNEQNELIKKLCHMSILLVAKYNKKLANTLKREKKDVTNLLDQLENNKQFVQDVTKEKKELTKEIKRIDEIINDKKLLQEEYDRRNELLPLEEKIFSAKILAGIMAKERDKLLDKMDELNVLLNPEKYMKYKTKLEIKDERLKALDVENLDLEIKRGIVSLQRVFLRCYKKKIQEVDNKQELLKMIYEFRYYCLLPVEENLNLGNIKALYEPIKKIQMLLIKKAHELKLIDVLAKQEELEYLILRNIFYTRIIKLENIDIKLEKDKNGFYSVQIFDEDIFDEKIVLNLDEDNFDKKDLLIKPNKKIKVFD